MVDTLLVALAVLTGFVTGAVFNYLQVPIPAPPNLAGIMGIVGIYVGYEAIEYLGWGFDVLEALGLT